jgi:hypothetical protein
MGLIPGFILQAFQRERRKILQKIIAPSHGNAIKIPDFMHFLKILATFSVATTITI